jgi:hypothetical protein
MLGIPSVTIAARSVAPAVSIVARVTRSALAVHVTIVISGAIGAFRRLCHCNVAVYLASSTFGFG